MQASVALADPVIARLDPGSFHDWVGLLDLIRTSFRYMDGLIDPPSSTHLLSVEEISTRACSETVFLALVAGRQIGCVFAADKGDRLYIGKLAVAPRAQGRGVGRRLLGAAEALAVAMGIGLLELQTRIELTANHDVFRRWGFVETGRTAHPGYDCPTSVTMRKELSP